MCLICETESVNDICDACVGEAIAAREVKDCNKLRAKKVGESVGKAAFTMTKWICKGVQQCAPLVTGATDGAKRAWKDAKKK